VYRYSRKKPGFWPRINTKETGFFAISSGVTKNSREKPGFSPPRDILGKNPVSRHTYNNLAITRPKQMSFTDNKLMDRTIPNPKSQ